VCASWQDPNQIIFWSPVAHIQPTQVSTNTTHTLVPLLRGGCGGAIFWDQGGQERELGLVYYIGLVYYKCSTLKRLTQLHLLSSLGEEGGFIDNQDVTEIKKRPLGDVSLETCRPQVGLIFPATKKCWGTKRVIVVVSMWYDLVINEYWSQHWCNLQTSAILSNVIKDLGNVFNNHRACPRSSPGTWFRDWPR
jgi:hypothetical protein